ncbi:hypothetical protein J2X76_006015 [Neorhizobium sp. 2083]|uniref:hypothetical protein n=1 Tax=Neorhizobium sp. 2083 TaxID=2817762 RepID=UPI002861A3BB|nr:hypothetical protein [Neorhizobium sp. 2083]MDR6820815.1 hypothetical protein [Neorhizobium sp. 2083]
MLILREADLRLLRQVLDDVCASRDAFGKAPNREAISLAALELYRKGFKEPEMLKRFLNLSPTAFQHR